MVRVGAGNGLIDRFNTERKEMYQIFVVEDELLIRQSVRNAVENMQGPYVCCGEASDGR